MKIDVIGGGPGGLYFAILVKKGFPEIEVNVYERNRPDDTFGWGVVFSDETLDNFERADPESFAEITRSFAYWTDIETYFGGRCVRSTGHGFSGLARKKLLEIFHARAHELGAQLHFETEIPSEAELDGDLIVAADGINSLVRERHADHFRPSLDWRKCKFTWLGTTKPLDAFTFIFRKNEHGVFQVHAYPFQRGEQPLSTWIVECSDDTYRAAGLDEATEEDTVRYVSKLFADHLDGYEVLTNRSVWRTFPTIKCERWSYENIVLLGDSAHTAHFSIGSGTKLAMEDSIALFDAFREHRASGVSSVLEAYEEARYVDVIKTQKAAQTSLEWFENSARYMGQDPDVFAFNLMTRSKRITYDNLALRDPALVERATVRWREQGGFPLTKTADGRTTPPLFTPLKLRDLELRNRIVVSPMCQYSAHDGTVNDWHLVHLGSRAVGGAGLVFTEMTNVSAEGRITYGCAGMYTDEHGAAWKKIVDFVHASSAAKIGIQLAHAGRKGSCHLPWEGDNPLTDGSAWSCLGPTVTPFGPGWPTVRAMDRVEMERVTAEFVHATGRALAAGFDLVEIHMAHGYLLSSFISPASNSRTDAYGGSLANRMRFPLEVLDAVRAAWPEERPLAVRISATDWLPGERGLTADDAVQVAGILQDHGCDLVDVSTAGNTPESKPEYGRMYQVPFAERIKHEVGIPVMAVGAIQGWDHANTILTAERADLCALARPHLVDPHITLRAGVAYGFDDPAWPVQYLPAKPK